MELSERFCFVFMALSSYSFDFEKILNMLKINTLIQTCPKSRREKHYQEKD